MTLKNFTQEDFDYLSERFLETQEDTSRDKKYYTERDMAENVLEKLKAFLGDYLAREQRRAEYLKLKAEFEGELP